MKPGIEIFRRAFLGNPARRNCISAFGLGLLFWAGAISGAASLDLLTQRGANLSQNLGGNGDSVAPQLSPDGRFVVFSSSASDLVTNDNAWLSVDIFLRDRVNGTTKLVSENFQGTGGGNDHSMALAVSTNGRYVLFESVASDLVDGDTNGLNDIFVRDCQTEATHLVSVAIGGGPANDAATDAVMTPDGRFVAFVSAAKNLVVGDTNGLRDVFVRDLINSTTVIVTAGASPATRTFSFPSLAPLMAPEAPVITPDGRYVAFFSTNDFATGVPFTSTPYGSVGEVYVRDLAAGTTTWVSSNAFSLAYSNLSGTKFLLSYHPNISMDGRYVSFKTSFADRAGITTVFRMDLVSGVLTLISTNGVPQGNGLRHAAIEEIFGPEMTPDGQYVAYGNRLSGTNFFSVHLWDSVSGTNTLVSGDSGGVVQTNASSYGPVFSLDGRYLAFVSEATNLVSNTISNGTHIYRRDLVSNTTELVDADLVGVGAALLYPSPHLSADGRFVAYSAPDGGFVAADDNRFEDVFVRDMIAATNELISWRNSGLVPQTGNALSLPGLVSLSADGHRVAFASTASDLVADDTNNTSDVFVWDRLLQTNVLVSIGTNGQPGHGGASFQPQLSGDGRYVLFQSLATNLVASDTNGQFDVFLRDLQLQVTTLVSVTTNGVSLGSYDAPRAAMSPDAQRVVFVCRTNTTGSTYLTFWRDLVSGETRLLSAAADSLRQPTLSTNGLRVTYFDSAARLYVWDAIGQANLYTNSAAISSAVLSPGGNRVLYQTNPRLYCYDLNVRSNLNSWLSAVVLKTLPAWSPDERFVTFVSASALVSGDTNAVSDVYFCDLQTGTLSLISANAVGNTSGSGASDVPSFSTDGRFIAYRSLATNLLAEASAAPGLLVFDRATGSNKLVVARSLLPGMSWISWPAINGNGDTIAFKTVDAGLVAGDLNQTVDAFAGSLSVLSLADGDTDGIPDWWLQQYFGHSDGQEGDLSRAGDDADGDGMTNLQEFFAGTDPTDENSALWMEITLTPPTGTNVVLNWPGQVGKNYILQFTDDLSIWQNLPVAVQMLGGQASANVSRTNLARIFRVRLEP